MKAMSISALPLILWASLATTAWTYQINYVDCTQPSVIKMYDVRTACEKPVTLTKANQEFTLLQRRRIFQANGWSCSMRTTRLHGKCGAWSHFKWSSPPEIEMDEQISEQACEQMITNRRFRPYLSTTDYPLKMSRTNVISFSEIGNLHEERDSVRCTGETVHIRNSIHTNVVQLVTYKIVLQPEKLTVRGSTVEVDSQHVKLPCPFESRSCTTGKRTYIWNTNQPDCALEKVKIFHPIRVMDTYLYDFEQKILINTTGNTKIPGCDDIDLETTTYADLFVSRSTQARLLQEVTSRDVDIVYDYKMSDDYLEYSIVQKVSDSAAVHASNLCREQMQGRRGEGPVPLAHGKYGLVKGNILYVFLCKNGTGNILELDKCHEDIPIQSNPPKFVDTTTQILKSHSPVAICDKRFPLTVKATTGWITINPHIQPTSPPESGRPEVPAEEFKHQDLHLSGLYTQEQREAWEALVNFPNYHQALLKGISWGNCKETADCASNQEQMQGIPGYDLGRLIPEGMPEFNIWKDLQQWILDWGAYLAFAVIVITITKVLINITILSITLIKEGPAALIALLTLICCQPQQSYKKVKRRNQRIKSEEDLELGSVPKA